MGTAVCGLAEVTDEEWAVWGVVIAPDDPVTDEASSVAGAWLRVGSVVVGANGIGGKLVDALEVVLALVWADWLAAVGRACPEPAGCTSTNPKENRRARTRGVPTSTRRVVCVSGELLIVYWAK